MTGLGRLAAPADPKNPPRTSIMLTPGRRHVCVLHVLADRVRAHLDGQLVIDYQTNYEELLPSNDVYQPADRKILAIGSWDNPTVFHSVYMIERSGRGVVTR